MRACERHGVLRHGCCPSPRMGPLWGKWRSSLVVSLALVVTACLPDPQRGQSITLLNQLVAARTMLAAQPSVAPDQACTTVGDVQTRLTGEPGLVNVSA